MFTQSLAVPRVQLVSIVTFVMLCASFFILQTPFASAQVRSSTTLDELQLQIQMLMAQLAALNGISVPTNTEMTIGSKVETTTLLRVRGMASGSGIIKGMQSLGAQGTIVQGAIRQGGIAWVKVDFVSGVDGWVSSQWLKRVSALNSYNCNPSGACPDVVLQDNVKPSVTELLAVANLNTLSTGAKGVSIDGSFEIEITAQDSSIYVNPSSMSIFPSVGEKSAATDNPIVTKSVTSDATKVGNYYMIAEGESRVFKINFQYFPRENGTYTMVMQNFEYALTPAGRTFTKELYPNRPETNKVLFINDTSSQGIEVTSNGTDAQMNIVRKDQGYFTVKFEVTAVDQDIYIKPTAQNRSQSNGGVKFAVEGATDLIVASLSSAAKKTPFGAYIVSEGETIGFTAEVKLTAEATGNYRVLFEGLSFSNEPSGTQNLKFAAFNPASDFRTPSINLATASVPLKYEISMYSPTENKIFKTGERVILEWKTTNLANEIAVVTLYGNNSERYMLRNIPLNSGTASFIIPASDSLGTVVSGTYKVMIAVVGTKDGDPKNVTDTVSITINNSTVVVPAPQKNIFGCNRSVTTKVASGLIACYGMWDYGNDFGGDVKMCGSYDGKIGCVIQTPVCNSGTAKATKYIGNASLTATNLPTISRRLGVSEVVAKAGIAGLWEYTCIAPVTASPLVLGASTNILSEISNTLTSLKNIINDMK